MHKWVSSQYIHVRATPRAPAGGRGRGSGRPRLAPEPMACQAGSTAAQQHRLAELALVRNRKPPAVIIMDASDLIAFRKGHCSSKVDISLGSSKGLQVPASCATQQRSQVLPWLNLTTYR